VGIGRYFGDRMLYRDAGFTVNPIPVIVIDGAYTAWRVGELTDEYYTITLTWRILNSLYLRSYYQHLSLMSAHARKDVLNLLVSYYMTNRNNIYFLINLLDNLKTTDLMARIGYEIDF
jgi:hypothetical protein